MASPGNIESRAAIYTKPKDEPTAEDGDQEDIIKKAAQQTQQQALIPLVEDLSEWLNNALGLSDDQQITPDSFLDKLDNGVLLCSLIEKIQRKQNNPLKEKIKYNKNAGNVEWYCRDNAATFINWCRNLGVKRELLFESEGLVSHRSKREVVLCLLELSRIASRFGVEPPGLIQLEKEVEKDERIMNSIKSADPKTIRKSDLDSEILAVTCSCKCDPEFYVEKLRDGIYTLGNKRCLIRKFKTRHIMVRVGGGWDTLEHYLSCHDPCRIIQFSRAANAEHAVNPTSNRSDHRFVHAKGKYNKS